MEPGGWEAGLGVKGRGRGNRDLGARSAESSTGEHKLSQLEADQPRGAVNALQVLEAPQWMQQEDLGRVWSRNKDKQEGEQLGDPRLQCNPSFSQVKAAERTAKHQQRSSWEGCSSLAAAPRHSQSQVGLRRLCRAELSHQQRVLLSCSPCCPTTLILHRRQTRHFHANELWAWKQAKTNSGI